MVERRCGAAFSLVLLVLALPLGGCSGPEGLYHKFEGGAIAQNRQAPPGADLPYPNLADVPPPPPAPPPGTQAAITAAARTGVSAPSPGALAGLTLPAAPPPLPHVPGVGLGVPPPAPSAPVPVAAPAPKPPGLPQAVAFRSGSALLPPEQAKQLAAFAAQRGAAAIRVAGFGEGKPSLAIARARRIADELTAHGVPPGEISLAALAEGSGGFVQLVY